VNYLLEDLVDKVADIEVGTKLVHLLDFFPKFRSAFQQKLKLSPGTTTKTTEKETVITNAVNKLSENKISKYTDRSKDNMVKSFWILVPIST